MTYTYTQLVILLALALGALVGTLYLLPEQGELHTALMMLLTFVIGLFVKAPSQGGS